MDKEKLIKHHFWIVLVLAILMLPVVLSGVWMGVASATDEQAKKVDSEKKKVDNTKPKGKDYWNKMEEGRKKLEDSKDVVWKKVYDAQKGLIVWPKALSHLDDAYFGDPIPEDDVVAFQRKDVYQAEFESLAEMVKPTELTGGWKQVMRVVNWGNTPSKEECWLALEDLCIQREMLRCVHAVNELLAQFTDVSTPGPKDDEKTKADKAKVAAELKTSLKLVDGEVAQRFISPYWQLDIVLSKSPQGLIARGRLTNMSQRRLNVGKIDLHLWLRNPQDMTNADDYERERKVPSISIEGDYVAAGKDMEGHDRDGNHIDFKNKPVRAVGGQTHIYAVEQILDARYVPVKRIEAIVLGKNSHRTADKPLVMCGLSEEEKKASGAGAAPADAAAAAAAAAASGQTGDRTPLGIDRLRYLTVTRQVRRMPIGIDLIVDQAHVQDVLRALANSRLRWQTVQMHVSRYRGSLGSVGAPAYAPPLPASNGFGGLSMNAPTEEPNANLVEVAVYGLASIYEKFPPKPATTPAAPAAPPKTK